MANTKLKKITKRRHKCSPKCIHSRNKAIPLIGVSSGVYSKILSDRRKAFHQNIFKGLNDKMLDIKDKPLSKNNF